MNILAWFSRAQRTQESCSEAVAETREALTQLIDPGGLTTNRGESGWIIGAYPGGQTQFTPLKYRP